MDLELEREAQGAVEDVFGVGSEWTSLGQAGAQQKVNGNVLLRKNVDGTYAVAYLGTGRRTSQIDESLGYTFIQDAIVSGKTFSNEADAIAEANKLYHNTIVYDERMAHLETMANAFYDKAFGNKDGMPRTMRLMRAAVDDEDVYREMYAQLRQNGLSHQDALVQLNTMKGAQLDDGTFVVFLDNMNSLADLATTIRHEGLHAGLRSMIDVNDANALKEFITKASQVLSGNLKDWKGDALLDADFEGMTLQQRGVVIQETLAQLAEVRARKPALGGRIAQAVVNLFHKDSDLSPLSPEAKMREAQAIINDAFFTLHSVERQRTEMSEEEKLAFSDRYGRDFGGPNYDARMWQQAQAEEEGRETDDGAGRNLLPPQGEASDTSDTDTPVQAPVNTIPSSGDTIVTPPSAPQKPKEPTAEEVRGFDPAAYDWSKRERNGRDVTAKDFKEVFGLDNVRGDQKRMNEAYDGFRFLAREMNIPYEAIGIGGLLDRMNLSNGRIKNYLGGFRYRASGNFSEIVIKRDTREAALVSILIHEWAHALDQALGRGKDFDKKKRPFTAQITKGDSPSYANVRPGLSKAYKTLMEKVNQSTWNKRSVNTERGYYGKPTERFARLMESVLSVKSNGAYTLPYEYRRTSVERANAQFEARSGIKMKLSPDEVKQFEAYPTKEETEALVPAFDEFFNAIRVGTNEATGRTTLFRMGREELDAMPALVIKNTHPTVTKSSLKDIARSIKFEKNDYDHRVAHFPAGQAGKWLYQSGEDIQPFATALGKIYKTSKLLFSEDFQSRDGHKDHPDITKYHHYIRRVILQDEDDNETAYYVRTTLTETPSANKENPSRFEVHAETISSVAVYNEKGDLLSTLGPNRAHRETPQFVDIKISQWIKEGKPLGEAPDNQNWVGLKFEPAYNDAIARGDTQKVQEIWDKYKKEMGYSEKSYTHLYELPDKFLARFVQTMPQEFIDEIASWDVVSKSPYGDSYYSATGITWDYKPEGVLRIADHWNWYSQGEQHCVTDVPVENNTHWTLAQYRDGVWHVIKTLPVPVPFKLHDNGRFYKAYSDELTPTQKQFGQFRDVYDAAKAEQEARYVKAKKAYDKAWKKQTIGRDAQITKKNWVKRGGRFELLGEEVYEGKVVKISPSMITIETADGTLVKGKEYRFTDTVDEIDTSVLSSDLGVKIPKVTINEKTGSVKLDEPITYDANGKIIPLSQRLNSEESSVLFRMGREENASYNAVVRQYTNPDGTKKRGWMRAPNGKQTNLSERQWVQVRTPSFKRWFGDWELKYTEFEVVEAALAPFNNVTDALAFAQQNGIIGLMSADETGGKGEINISIVSVREMLNPSQRNKSVSNEAHFAVLTKLKEVIRDSRIIESHPDYKKGPDGKRDPKYGVNNDITIDVAYGAIRVGESGEPYRVKTTLKRYADKASKTKAYAYEVTEIEVLTGNLVDLQKSTNPKASTSINGTILLNGVKNSNGNRVLEDHSKVVDENGEPRVVYHGSPNSFSEFRDGTFFSDNENVANGYAHNKNIYATFLSIKNPIEIDVSGDKWSMINVDNLSINGIENVKTFLKENGADIWKEKGAFRTTPVDIKAAIDNAMKRNVINVDGVILKNIEDSVDGKFNALSTDFITFSPTQNKSATDNVGTFDGRNPSIFFRMGNPPGVDDLAERVIRTVKEQQKGSKLGGVQAKWESFKDAFQKGFINSQAPVFKAIRRVMGGRKLADELNVEAVAKNTQGRIQAEHDRIQHQYIDRINKILQDNGLDLATFDEYLYALFAAERNAQIAERTYDPITGEFASEGSGMSNEEARQVLSRMARFHFKSDIALVFTTPLVNKHKS